MAPPYTKLLGQAELPAAVPHPLGTVPLGKTWVVRDLLVFNGGSGPGRFYLQAHHSGYYYTLVSEELEPSVGFHLGLRQALHAGTELSAYATAPILVMSVTGYELSSQ